ncbi:MAG: TIGR03862 family flavoprotein [Amylibacter sp.]|nr:TIGR03862 family flavoprotein [Amylibacter sp.]
MTDLCVIGAGPAGLMAAEVAADAGLSVLIADAKPSFGRKFLMAGKSGLNLTKDEPFADFTAAFGTAQSWLKPMLENFSNTDVQTWATALGQEVFTGSSGKVFPKTMKASPLLRAWLLRLTDKGVQFKTRWKWTGWDGSDLSFQTPDGSETIPPRTCVLALGGASWPKLGSDGAWADIFANEGINLSPFKPANMGFTVNWSDYMKPHFGAPIKTVMLTSGNASHRGDFVISSKGIEGSGVYAVSRNMREGANLFVDLLPDTDIKTLQDRIDRLSKKASRSSALRKALRLDPAKAALLNEFARNVTLPNLAQAAKKLQVKHAGPRPIAEAISTAGGIPQSELTEHLMLRKKSGIFCAGEMLNWEAPTGGYLITGCLATGRQAGLGAVAYLST